MADKFTFNYGTKNPNEMVEIRTGYNPKLNTMGKSMINQLFMLIRTIQIHEIDNVALVKPLENLLNTMNMVIAMEGVLDISLSDNVVFINDIKLKMDTGSYGNVEFLSNHLTSLGIGSITIKKSLDYNALRRFLFLLSHPEVKEGTEIAARDLLQKRLNEENIIGIVLSQVKEKKPDDDDENAYLKDQRLFALHTYAKAIISIKDFMNSLPSEGPTDRLRIRRIVQDLVDLVFDDSLIHVFLGLASIKYDEEYVYNHAVNSCVLAIAFGRRVGLPKKKLLYLGLSALFCDVGKAYIPNEILQKKDELDETEWQQMKQHSLFSVKAFLLKRGLSEDFINRMVVAFEHHIDYSLEGGYPSVSDKKDLNLFSRIVAIVDNFDALTTSKEYRDAYLPDEALKIMLEQGGSKFDPVLLKIFVNMIGMYPIGTMVQLTTREIGIVYHNSHDPKKFDRPKVKLVFDASGTKIKGTRIIDLMELQNGQFVRSVTRTLDPLKFEVNVQNVILGVT